MSSTVTDTETVVAFRSVDQPLEPHQEPHNATWCVAIGLRLEPDANGGEPHIILDPVDDDLAHDLNVLTEYGYDSGDEGSRINTDILSLSEVTRRITLLAAASLGDPHNPEYEPGALVPEVFVNQNSPYFLMAEHFMKGTNHAADPLKTTLT